MSNGWIAFIVIGVLVAFWAGRRWQHFMRAWSDHKGAVTMERGARKARWVTLRAALVAVAALAAYLIGTGVISVHLG